MVIVEHCFPICAGRKTNNPDAVFNQLAWDDHVDEDFQET